MKEILACSLLLLATPVVAQDPSHRYPELREEARALVRGMTWPTENSGTGDLRDAMNRHLAMLETHLAQIRAEVCESCGAAAIPVAPLEAAMLECRAHGQVESALTPQEYEDAVGPSVKTMRDHLSRMSRERSPFKRQQQLMGYYRHAVHAFARAQPQCRPGSSC